MTEMAEQADGERYAAVIHPHLPAVLRVAAALVGTADAEDAAQEALLRGWQAWHTLHSEVALHSWLLRITVNVCLDWQRGRFGTQRRLVEPLDTTTGKHPLASIDADPGDSLHTAVMDLRQALDSLDANSRLVIVLRYYAGMDASEIGEALGIPSATIRTRLRRALGLLRMRLDGSQDVHNSGETGKQPDGVEGMNHEGEIHAH
ncbi:MAG TPA: RNA polymerase sigma factor [Ktedonobacterales bacterium]|nr:RNA polymerase sigma factor [Ktedonobacterales bacterium]